jgi:hypothetical protein
MDVDKAVSKEDVNENSQSSLQDYCEWLGKKKCSGYMWSPKDNYGKLCHTREHTHGDEWKYINRKDDDDGWQLHVNPEVFWDTIPDERCANQKDKASQLDKHESCVNEKECLGYCYKGVMHYKPKFVDECEADNGGCHANATCQHLVTMDTRSCKCKPGFWDKSKGTTDGLECKVHEWGLCKNDEPVYGFCSGPPEANEEELRKQCALDEDCVSYRWHFSSAWGSLAFGQKCKASETVLKEKWKDIDPFKVCEKPSSRQLSVQVHQSPQAAETPETILII